jgi:nickel-dependent lactate racemase
VGNLSHRYPRGETVLSLLFERTDNQGTITDRVIEDVVKEICRKLRGLPGPPPGRILLVPPDGTRIHSGAGFLTTLFYRHLSGRTEIDVMPALGTHTPMTEQELRGMFGTKIPIGRFLQHDWKNSTLSLGKIPAEEVSAYSGGLVDFPIAVSINKRLFSGYDRIISIGQVVPHEATGMSNYTKNICVGLGGADLINKSHYIGAVCGMETAMGRIDTPVRRLINDIFNRYLYDLPIFFALTVMDETADGSRTAGLFFGDSGNEAFQAAAALSRQLNIFPLNEPIRKGVVSLDPRQYTSTWLGNKSIYRLRMAMADEGELIVLAPGLRRFGEDEGHDRLIRKYGYRGTPFTVKAVEENEDLRLGLAAAAHLIHGSSEGRFKITYCPGPGLSRDDIEGVGYGYMPIAKAEKIYNPGALTEGWNTTGTGEKIFFTGNPAKGLWTLENK